MNSDSLNMVSRLGEGHMPWTFFLSEPQLKTTVKDRWKSERGGGFSHFYLPRVIIQAKVAMYLAHEILSKEYNIGKP